MSLPRELAVILLSVISAFFLFRATFLFIESNLSVPGTHPLLADRSVSFSDLPPRDASVFKRSKQPPAKLILPPIFSPPVYTTWQPVEKLMLSAL